MEVLDYEGLGYFYNKLKQKQNVFYNTTEGWDKQTSLIAKKGAIYIYGDYKKAEDGNPIAGIKVGTGTAYLIDLPFTTEIYDNHINDKTIHITGEEREFWNNKVSCFISEVQDENVTFTID